MDAVGPGGGVVPGRAGGGGGNLSSEYGIAAADGSFELPGCQQRTAQEQGDEAHRQQGWHSEVAPACRCRCPESLFHANRLLSGHRSGHGFPQCPTSSECRAVRVYHRRIGAVSEVPVSRARSEALRRLRGSVEFGGCSRGDVLGSAVRRPLTEAFADPAVASRVFGLRGAAVQHRWSCLVRACADSPTALGFVQVDGSLRNLADRLGVDDDAFLRNLRTWGAKRPPIVVAAESKGPRGAGGAKGRKASVIVQVPLLSAWLLWTADARSVVYRGMQGFIGPERIRQVAVTLIAHGDHPPAEKALLPLDADRLIRLASSR